MINLPPEHPLYDHQPHRLSPPPNCPEPLCIRDIPCVLCPLLPKPQPYVPIQLHQGWGGRRAGAGAPKGSFNHLKTGQRSALIRRAVEVLAEHKELRPFLLLIARAASEGEIPQTTRRLIQKALEVNDAKTLR